MTPTLADPHDPPLYLERQKAVYVGRVVEEGDTGFAYYLHGQDELLLGALSEGGFEPRFALDADTTTMGEAATAFRDLDGSNTELSILGNALCDADGIAETGVLGVRQAYVYVLREIYGFSQQDTAKILDVGFSTVSTQLANAKSNVEQAMAFATRNRELAEKKDRILA